MDSREELIDKARETARRRGASSLTLAEFRRENGVSSYAIYAQFKDWPELCRHAGLECRPANVRISDDAMYRAMHDAFVELGGIASRDAFSQRFRYSAGVFYRRGLGWPGALRGFRAWAEKNAPGFPYLDQLPDGPARTARPGRP